MAGAEGLLKTASSKGRRTQFMGAAWCIAFCSISYELILAKLITELTGETILWESLSIGAFLLGMGLRCLRPSPKSDPALWQQLLATEARIISVAAAAGPMMCIAEVLYRIYVYSGVSDGAFSAVPLVALLGVACQLGTFAVGWISGFELQFFLHYGEGRLLARQEPAVLAVYHLGALGATLVFPVLLNQGWSPLAMLVLVCSGNLLLLVGLRCGSLAPDVDAAALTKVSRFSLQLAWPAVAAVALAALCHPLEDLSRRNRYGNRALWHAAADGHVAVQEPLGLWSLLISAATLTPVDRIRSPYQIIDIVRSPQQAPPSGAASPSWMGRRRPFAEASVHINGRFQVGGASAAAYHEPMVHVAMAMTEQPRRRLLVLGGGDGALVRELRQYDPQLTAVALVDIDPRMLELARTDPVLRAINGDALSWPRLRVSVGDAMSYLREGRALFDAIFVDLTYPFEFDSSRFYSVEFFRLLRRHLAGDGFFVVGSPLDLAEQGGEEWCQILQKTAGAAGFAHQLAVSGPRDHFFVAGLSALRQPAAIPAFVKLRAIGRLPGEQWSTAIPVNDPARGWVNTVMRPRPLGVADNFF